MRPTLSFLFLYLFLSYSVQAQDTNCDYTQNPTAWLDANEIKAAIRGRGGLFHKDSETAFLVDDSIGTIFATGLWVAGIGADDEVKAATSVYGWVANDYDWFNGPLREDGTTDSLICDQFNHIWKVEGTDIRAHIEDYEDNGRIDQRIPKSILHWAGRGNNEAANAQGTIDLPNQELAPFFDRNRNRRYEPHLGDYPVIGKDMLQVIPDQLIWYVFNDAGNAHTHSEGESLGVEVQLTAWAFDCDANTVLDETIFTRHRVIYKKDEPLRDVRIAMWTDYDLGCYTDDYFGCDTLLNTTYFYNADNVDGEEDMDCPHGVPTFSSDPPAQTMTLLNQPMTSLSYYAHFYRGGVGGMTNPDRPKEFYDYMDAHWLDETPLTIGDDGYKDGATTRYAFFDNPNNSLGWSMFAEELGLYFEPRVIMSTTTDQLVQHESFDIDFAYSFHRKPENNHLENVDYALERVPQVQSIYNSKFSDIKCSPTTATLSTTQNQQFLIAPNPNDGQFSLHLPTSMTGKQHMITLYDLQGSVCFQRVVTIASPTSITLSLSLNSGIYFLTIRSLEDKHLLTGRLRIEK